MTDTGKTLTLKPTPLHIASVKHVCSGSLLDVSIMLDFGLMTLQRVSLADVELEEDLVEGAKWSLISICPGGDEVVVEPLSRNNRVAGVWPVYLYRKGYLPAEDCVVEIDGVQYVNVNRYMTWLSGCSFASDVVKSHVKILRGRNGKLKR